MNLNLLDFLNLSIILFLIGIWGIVLNRKNLIIMLMAIELILLAINFNFLVYSVYFNEIYGQIFAMFVLTVAAAESSIGLAIIVAYFRVRESINMDHTDLLKN